jgi:thymidylate synthase ThyX
VDIDKLIHVRRPLNSGGQIVILNDGAIITAEDKAMIQAMYSRSPASIDEHLKKLAQVGSGKFMDTFYVGYGHKSIGDCGDVCIFVEGVSMLVAKAFQDSMLYRGQECSTRYLDFSTQPFLNPYNSPVIDGYKEKWRDFYVTHMPAVKKHVANQFPRKEEEDEKIYDKAIAARAFDIMRSFLPAGAATSFSITSDLRQIADRLLELRHHPLIEVKEVAEKMLSALREVYPNSFNQKVYPATEDFYQSYMEGEYFLKLAGVWPNDVKLVRQGIDKVQLGEYSDLLQRRPKMVEIPKKVARTGTAQFRWQIDFGSYRDQQRHRAVIQTMPLLTPHVGFESWYLDQLPEDVARAARGQTREFMVYLSDNYIDPYQQQYLIPMGFKVQCEVTGDLPALVYMVELRSGSTVHPTMRRRAQQVGIILDKLFTDVGLVLHIDHSDIGRFDTKRGKQDIVAKV